MSNKFGKPPASLNVVMNALSPKLQRMEDEETIREMAQKYGVMPVIEQFRLAWVNNGKKEDAEMAEQALLRLWEYVKTELPRMSPEEQRASRKFLFGAEEMSH